MLSFFRSIKGRALAAVVIFLAASHVLTLLVYVGRSQEAADLLHDALVAEQIVLVSKLVEGHASDERSRLIKRLDDLGLRVAQGDRPTLGGGLPEGTRPHVFEHLLAVFLNRQHSESIRLAYTPEKQASELKRLIQITDEEGAPTEDLSHLPQQALSEIASLGNVQTEVRLLDGSWLRFDTPLLSIGPFSTWKFSVSLLVGLFCIMAAAVWVMTRSTQPLTDFARAAERLGTDIKSPPLSEKGPAEVRAAAQAFNRMQERLRQLIDDRIQLAAAIAHDLGTPVTRLRLRAADIENDDQRKKILDDLAQMQRMIGATLDFSRQDLAVEPYEIVDLSSMLQSVTCDFVDVGQEVILDAPARATARLRPHAMYRALTNVIGNAIKYGKRAHVRLLESSEVYTIEVTDEGPGIPEHLHTEAFRPFRRLAEAAEDQAQGAGLGLTVAQTIIRDHGGEIALSIRPEGGLRVQITLPIQLMLGSD